MRDALERRYDGPIPAADPAHPPVCAVSRARLFQRLASDARAQSAHRRARLRHDLALGDMRLSRLASDLHLYRALGVAWRE